MSDGVKMLTRYCMCCKKIESHEANCKAAVVVVIVAAAAFMAFLYITTILYIVLHNMTLFCIIIL